MSLRELRQTQKRHEEAINQESKCRSEYYRAQQEAYAAKTALNSFIGDYKSAKCLIHFLRRVFEIAKELEVKSLAAEAAVAEGLFHEAREYQQRLRNSDLLKRLGLLVKKSWTLREAADMKETLSILQKPWRDCRTIRGSIHSENARTLKKIRCAPPLLTTNSSSFRNRCEKGEAFHIEEHRDYPARRVS